MVGENIAEKESKQEWRNWEGKAATKQRREDSGLLRKQGQWSDQVLLCSSDYTTAFRNYICRIRAGL
jgi:hypothetical protein